MEKRELDVCYDWDKPYLTFEYPRGKQVSTKFSKWYTVVTPNPNKVWFSGTDGTTLASVDQIPVSKLPIGALGVYEIAIETRVHWTCVYVGRAKSVRNNLRKRLGEYIRGTYLSNELGYFLRLGCDISVRWAILDNADDAVEAERVLLQDFDYAFNKHNNGLERAPNEVLLPWEVLSRGLPGSGPRKLVEWLEEERDAEALKISYDRLSIGAQERFKELISKEIK